MPTRGIAWAPGGDPAAGHRLKEEHVKTTLELAGGITAPASRTT